jgi:hypothetical protein
MHGTYNVRQVVMHHLKGVTYFYRIQSQLFTFLLTLYECIYTHIIFVVMSDRRFYVPPVILQLKFITFKILPALLFHTLN